MNNYGFGLREFLGFLTCILIALFIAMVMYHKNFGELFDSSVSSQSYQDIEKDLANVAIIYTDNYYYKVLENGDSDYVTIKTLKEEKIITKVTDLKDHKLECSGYIHFYKENSKTIYDPYIKCGDNYQTAGYNKDYDEAL